MDGSASFELVGQSKTSMSLNPYCKWMGLQDFDEIDIIIPLTES